MIRDAPLAFRSSTCRLWVSVSDFVFVAKVTAVSVYLMDCTNAVRSGRKIPLQGGRAWCN